MYITFIPLQLHPKLSSQRTHIPNWEPLIRRLRGPHDGDIDPSMSANMFPPVTRRTGPDQALERDIFDRPRHFAPAEIIGAEARLRVDFDLAGAVWSTVVPQIWQTLPGKTGEN